jgi:carbonic anhydrase
MLKRSLMIVTLCAIAITLRAPAQNSAAACPNKDCVSTPGDPQELLTAGNLRFTGEAQQHPRQSKKDSAKLQCCQAPFAAVLSCSDSRVPPEVLFDQGFGDLFVVRLAGNVATKDALGSIEYAVTALHTHFVVVLGHQRCGAVQAAFCAKKLDPNLDNIWTLLRPSVPKDSNICSPRYPDEEAWKAASERNVDDMRLKVQNDLARVAPHDNVVVARAYYSMDDGKVVWDWK